MEINHLPDYVVQLILNFLSPIEQLASQRVCRRFYTMALQYVREIDDGGSSDAQFLSLIRKCSKLTRVNILLHRKNFPQQLALCNKNITSLWVINFKNEKVINNQFVHAYLSTVKTLSDSFNASNIKYILTFTMTQELCLHTRFYLMKNESLENSWCGILYGVEIDASKINLKHALQSATSVRVLRFVCDSTEFLQECITKLAPQFRNANTLEIDCCQLNEKDHLSSLAFVFDLPQAQKISIVVRSITDMKTTINYFIDARRNDFKAFYVNYYKSHRLYGCGIQAHNKHDSYPQSIFNHRHQGMVVMPFLFPKLEKLVLKFKSNHRRFFFTYTNSFTRACQLLQTLDTPFTLHDIQNKNFVTSKDLSSSFLLNKRLAKTYETNVTHIKF